MENKEIIIDLSLQEIEEIITTLQSLPVGNVIPNTNKPLAVLFLTLVQKRQEAIQNVQQIQVVK